MIGFASLCANYLVRTNYNSSVSCFGDLIHCVVDLKHITNDQIIEYTYEGQSRRFAIHSITRKSSVKVEPEGANEKLVQEFKNLTVDAPLELWSVSWDSLVTIQDEVPTEEDPSHKVRQLDSVRHLTFS